MIRQTDDIRITPRCKRQTMYYNYNKKHYNRVNHCAYLEDGKCTLNACIRREKVDWRYGY
jgi:hypothetical protein